MKIIDFDKKGNLVRFWLGADDCSDYWGDDWDDAPYEHNAGCVYSEYVIGHVDYVFPFETLVLEPCDDWHYRDNTPYCKDDMKKKMCPCIVAVSKQALEQSYEDTFQFWATSDIPGVKKFFFGDIVDGAYVVPDNRIQFAE